MWTRALRAERTLAIASDPFGTFDTITNDFLENREKYDGDLSVAIKEFLTIEDAIALLNKFAECTCCERHQVNRPTIMKYNSQPARANMHDSEHRCTCCCRHAARWICTAYLDIVDYNIQDEP